VCLGAWMCFVWYVWVCMGIRLRAHKRTLTPVFCVLTLQCVAFAVCCSCSVLQLQCVAPAVCCNCSVLLCAAVCCRVLPCAAECCSVSQCVAVCCHVCSVLPCAAVCCTVLAVCCTVSQCDAVHCCVCAFGHVHTCIYIYIQSHAYKCRSVYIYQRIYTHTFFEYIV